MVRFVKGERGQRKEGESMVVRNELVKEGLREKIHGEKWVEWEIGK